MARKLDPDVKLKWHPYPLPPERPLRCSYDNMLIPTGEEIFIFREGKRTKPLNPMHKMGCNQPKMDFVVWGDGPLSQVASIHIADLDVIAPEVGPNGG